MAERGSKRGRPRHREGFRKVEAVGAESRAAVARLDGITRDIATGTVTRQLWGLIFVGTGSVVSILPTVFGW
jgi:hypothetical protein